MQDLHTEWQSHLQCLRGVTFQEADEKFTLIPALLPLQLGRGMSSYRALHLLIHSWRILPKSLSGSSSLACIITRWSLLCYRRSSWQHSHLPSEGTCIALHGVFLITEPSYIGTTHSVHFLMRKMPVKKFSQTVKLDLNKLIALAEIDCPLALNWA